MQYTYSYGNENCIRRYNCWWENFKHLEVINHREAILYIEDIVRNKEEFTEWQIKNIHRLILKGINDKYAGNYRDQTVMISGAQHMPPETFLIKEQMENFIKWYNFHGQKLHPVERAAMVHRIFVGIHPFIDGNGRTSRLLLNLELMKNGYPPIVIKTDNRLKYYTALDKVHTTGSNEDFVEISEVVIKNNHSNKQLGHFAPRKSPGSRRFFILYSCLELSIMDIFKSNYIEREY